MGRDRPAATDKESLRLSLKTALSEENGLGLKSTLRRVLAHWERVKEATIAPQRVVSARQLNRTVIAEVARVDFAIVPDRSNELVPHCWTAWQRS